MADRAASYRPPFDSSLSLGLTITDSVGSQGYAEKVPHASRRQNQSVAQPGRPSTDFGPSDEPACEAPEGWSKADIPGRWNLDAPDFARLLCLSPALPAPGFVADG